jgi:hypothetical protein
MLRNIQKAFDEGFVIWRQHALTRMLERDITRKDVFLAIKSGKAIEQYPEAKPYPAILILAKQQEKTIHVLAAWDEYSQYAYVITAYIPDSTHFEKNGKTRKV